MKKVFFAGALAACMALSSVAFAADFGTTGGITGTYDKDTGKVSVTAIPTSITQKTTNGTTTNADQLTLVILSGASSDNTTIAKDNIMYIDQGALDDFNSESATTTKPFQGMGLKNNGTDGKLTDGKYTLRMGSDVAADITEVEFEVKTSGETETTEVTFIIGDVNGTGAANGTDAIDILSFVADSAKSLPSGATYAINSTVTDAVTKKSIVIGDVNGTGAANGTDAIDILSFVADSAKSLPSGATYAINSSVTLNVTKTAN